MANTSRLNIPLLLKVKAAILAEPRRFAMETFMAEATGERAVENPASPFCNTTMCIAGWATGISQRFDERAFTSLHAIFEAFSNESQTGGYGGTARRLLGLPTTALFCEEYWPEALYYEFREEEDKGNWQGMAEAAAKAIDAIIAGNGYFATDSEEGEKDAS